MQITKKESERFWGREGEKNIKSNIPLEAFVEQTEILVLQWIDEKPDKNRAVRLRVTLYRFRHAANLAHAAKMLDIPLRKARDYHAQALWGIMRSVRYLAKVHAGEQYEFHIFAVLHKLYERFEKQAAEPANP